MDIKDFMYCSSEILRMFSYYTNTGTVKMWGCPSYGIIRYLVGDMPFEVKRIKRSSETAEIIHPVKHFQRDGYHACICNITTENYLLEFESINLTPYTVAAGVDGMDIVSLPSRSTYDACFVALASHERDLEQKARFWHFWLKANYPNCINNVFIADPIAVENFYKSDGKIFFYNYLEDGGSPIEDAMFVNLLSKSMVYSRTLSPATF